MEIILKFIIIIPLVLSIKAALSLKEKSNANRAIGFLLIGAMIFVVPELIRQDLLVVKSIGVATFFYGVGIITYYKFLEGFRPS